MIQRFVDLTGFNSLGLPCTADRFLRIQKASVLPEILNACRRNGWKLQVLGGGSNVILPAHLTGCTLVMATRGIAVARTADTVRVTAAAGENWHNLVRFCVARGFRGIENLALIPGSVGAAPIQNIGAYGVELQDVFVSLEAMSLADGSVHEFNRKDCGFSYRHSRFKADLRDSFVILSVTLELSSDTSTFEPVLNYPDVQNELRWMGVDQPSSVAVCEAVIRIRRRKLPQRMGNAGSFFKNPVVRTPVMRKLRSFFPDLVPICVAEGYKLSAAALIDAAGCKHLQIGGGAVWFRQPLVLVNTGSATRNDIMQLAAAVQQRVAERFNIELEIEPLELPG